MTQHYEQNSEQLGWSKNGNQVYFLDNFGNSTLILTIFSLLQTDINGAYT